MDYDGVAREEGSLPLILSSPHSSPQTEHLFRSWNVLPWLMGPSLFLITLFIVALVRLTIMRSRKPVRARPRTSSAQATHLLIVLGSGGHTAEMLNILSQNRQLQLDYTHRTYVVSSGDTFSISQAHEFETTLSRQLATSPAPVPVRPATNYDVAVVHRARKVHQSLITAPVSSLLCLWDCVTVLQGTHRDINPDRRARAAQGARNYPDLILTNGPGTGVVVVCASILVLLVDWRRGRQAPDAQMRSIYIESWARVKTLSLSGRLLKPVVDRFLVQWPHLVERESKHVEYIGTLVS